MLSCFPVNTFIFWIIWAKQSQEYFFYLNIAHEHPGSMVFALGIHIIFTRSYFPLLTGWTWYRNDLVLISAACGGGAAVRTWIHNQLDAVSDDVIGGDHRFGRQQSVVRGGHEKWADHEWRCCTKVTDQWGHSSGSGSLVRSEPCSREEGPGTHYGWTG